MRYDAGLILNQGQGRLSGEAGSQRILAHNSEPAMDNPLSVPVFFSPDLVGVSATHAPFLRKYILPSAGASGNVTPGSP